MHTFELHPSPDVPNIELGYTSYFKRSALTELKAYMNMNIFTENITDSAAIFGNFSTKVWSFSVYCVRNVMTHGDAREGKWRGNWRMEWVASTLTRPRNVVYPVLLTLMRTPRLPAVDWTDSPADLNWLVRLGERRNVVSARVPSGSARNTVKVPELLVPCCCNWDELAWQLIHDYNCIVVTSSPRGVSLLQLQFTLHTHKR